MIIWLNSRSFITLRECRFCSSTAFILPSQLVSMELSLSPCWCGRSGTDLPRPVPIGIRSGILQGKSNRGGSSKDWGCKGCWDVHALYFCWRPSCGRQYRPARGLHISMFTLLLDVINHQGQVGTNLFASGTVLWVFVDDVMLTVVDMLAEWVGCSWSNVA